MRTEIKYYYPVTGMSCASCAASVESMLKSVKGVADAGVSYANEEAWVTLNDSDVTPEDLQRSVQAVGYDLLIGKGYEDDFEKYSQKHLHDLKTRTILSFLFALPVLVFGMFFMNAAFAKEISFLLSTPVLFIFGRSYFINAIKSAKHMQAGMDTLIALGTGISFLYSTVNTFFPHWSHKASHGVYFESAVLIIAFITLGKYLEQGARVSTSSAIKKLSGLQPDTVIIIDGSQEKEIKLDEVEKGMLVKVRAGERIPVDGVVKEGLSTIDESMITGESIPVEKKAGDKIFAGTINQHGILIFHATSVGKETVLGRIIQTIKEAQASKASSQKLADKISGIFVPVIISISILTFLGWIIFAGSDHYELAIVTAVSVLVIACPCALGLATPTALIAGIGKGAENNILIRDAETLEHARIIDAIVLDKTGTITEGKPVVVETFWVENLPAEEILNFQHILHSLEKSSTHPLANAITDYLGSAKTVELENVTTIPGKGIYATYKGAKYFAGNYSWLVENHIESDPVAEKKIKDETRSIVCFADEERLLGYFSVTDKIKQGVKDTISALQGEGIEVIMATGDNAKTANSVALSTGIKKVQAGLLPGDKTKLIEELKAEGKKVCVVGDGINDSEAMAKAHLSIAMGKGADIAMDVAHITLITSDFTAIYKAIKLSRKTVNTIRQNLFWAFIYNIIGIPIAAGVFYPINGFLLNPMFAGAAMAFSSVFVVGNSIRLKLIKL